MSSYVVENVDVYHVSLMTATSVAATIISTSVIIITIKYLPFVVWCLLSYGWIPSIAMITDVNQTAINMSSLNRYFET